MRPHFLFISMLKRTVWVSVLRPCKSYIPYYNHLFYNSLLSVFSFISCNTYESHSNETKGRDLNFHSLLNKKSLTKRLRFELKNEDAEAFCVWKNCAQIRHSLSWAQFKFPTAKRAKSFSMEMFLKAQTTQLIWADLWQWLRWWQTKEKHAKMGVRNKQHAKDFRHDNNK